MRLIEGDFHLAGLAPKVMPAQLLEEAAQIDHPIHQPDALYVAGMVN